MNKEINKRVAQIRKSVHLNQKQTAERMGMKYSTYRKMELSGNISAERIKKLAQIFGVEPQELLEPTTSSGIDSDKTVTLTQKEIEIIKAIFFIKGLPEEKAKEKINKILNFINKIIKE